MLQTIWKKRIKSIALCLMASIMIIFMMPAYAAPETQTTLRVAYRTDSSPLQYQDESGDARGILIDYWTTWSIASGIPVDFFGGSNSETQTWLNDEKVDLVAGLFRSGDREKSMIFSEPLLHSDYSLFYNPALADVNNRDDINIYSVGVTLDSFHHQWLKENYPNADIHTYNGYNKLFEAANKGEVQLFITQGPYFAKYRENHNVNMRFLSLNRPLYSRPYRAAIKKENTELLALVDRYIKQITNTDKDAISAKWSGFQWEYLPQEVVEKNNKNPFLAKLTEEEQNWLKSHPVLPIGVDGRWPPVDFSDEAGNSTGIINEYLKVLETRLGVTFEPQFYPTFKDMVTSVQEGDIPLGTTIVKTAEREENLWFTAPYFSAVKVLVSNRNGTQYSDLSELNHKVLAIENGYYLIDVLAERYPDITLKTFPTTSDALKALSFEKVDAYIGNQAVTSWLTQQLQLTNITISGDPGLSHALQRFAIYKDPEWEPLVTIINKALGTIAAPQRQAFLNIWLSNKEQFNNTAPLVLTDTQQKWLDGHTEWKMGVGPSWPPFEYIHNGSHKGISADVMDLLVADIGVETEAMTELDWQQVLVAFEQDEIDVLPLVSPTPERMKKILFTKPYLVSPYMILVQEETSFVNSINDILGYRVGIVKDYAINHLLNEDYPDLELVEFDNNANALISLSSGEIDAYIGVLGSSTWVLKDLGIRNVKIAAPTDYEFKPTIGIRKDWPELVPILNKAIDRLSEQDIERIEDQWFAVQFEHQASNYLIWRAIIITCLIVLPIIVVIFVWNRKIAKVRDNLKISRENLAEAKRAAEQANQFKSQFLANMSHEIRTPMNAIVGMTHLMQATDLSERQQDYAEKIKRASLSLLGIINDILDFSKIEAGKLEIEKAKFQLNDIILNLSNLFGLKSAEKGVDIFFDIDPHLPVSLMGDSLRLEQVLINLTQNALKFTEQGQVIVNLRLLNMTSNMVTIEFSVIDSGIGISPENLKKLFQPFTQADTSNTRTHGGTGLGLSISRQLVELMGGSITATSEVAKGSTFSFILNLETATEQKSSSLRSMGPELYGMRVLVVDDNSYARQINTEVLHSFSFHVDAVSNGRQALEVLEASNRGDSSDAYHLVLMDWKMPEMNGIEASQYIRKLDLNVMPAIILVTAYGREDIMRQAEAENLDAFLIKPLNASLLFDCIMKVFQQTKIEMEYAEPKIKQPLSGHVLLVEDQLINQDVAVQMLGLIGVTATTAQNGQEALDMLVKERFDLVLMDIQMPVMDGFEATTAIRNQPGFSDLPIVAMTAHAMKEDQTRCFEIGMNDHISKPIDPEKLYFVLSQWLDKKLALEVNQIDTDSDSTILLEQSIEGLDVQWGITRLGGNQELYQSLVGDFFIRHRNCLEEIHSARNNNRLHDVERMVHTIHGVAGNIGAKNLEQCAADFEAVLKSDEDPYSRSEWPFFESSFNQLFDALAQSSYVLNRTAPIDSTLGNDEPIESPTNLDLAQALAPLCELLENGDPKAKAILKDLEQDIPHDLYQQLSQQINEFEFDSALALLNANSDNHNKDDK